MTTAFFAPPADVVFFSPDARRASFCAAEGCCFAGWAARLASNLPFFLIGKTPYRNQSTRASDVCYEIYYGNNIISERTPFCNGISNKNQPEISEILLKNFQKARKNKRAAFVPAEKEVREKYVYESKMKNYAKVPKNLNIIWILMYVMHIDVF